MKLITDVGEGPWRSGYPSEPGWYNASIYKDETALRWYSFNRVWSDPVWPYWYALMAAERAEQPARHDTGAVLWRPLKAKYRARQDALRGKA